MSGCLATAMSSARATKSSGDTRTSANSGSSRTRRTAAIVSVTSTCRNSVTCGAVNALDTMAAAMCLRTPRIAMRSSMPGLGTAAEAAIRTPFSETAERIRVSVPAARCTSSLVIEPSGPLPASSARLTPRSLASLRTGGLASARTAGASGSAGTAAVLCGTASCGTASCGTASCGTASCGTASCGTASCGTALRGRRVVDEALTP